MFHKDRKRWANHDVCSAAITSELNTKHRKTKQQLYAYASNRKYV